MYVIIGKVVDAALDMTSTSVVIEYQRKNTLLPNFLLKMAICKANDINDRTRPIYFNDQWIFQVLKTYFQSFTRYGADTDSGGKDSR